MGKSKGGTSQHAGSSGGAAVFDVNRVAEGLKATRDVDVNLAALQSLQRWLRRGSQAVQHLTQLLSSTPQLPDLLFAVWDAQLKARSNPQLLVTLLGVMADILHVVRSALQPATAAGGHAAAVVNDDEHGTQAVDAGTSTSIKRKADGAEVHARESKGQLQQQETATSCHAATTLSAADAAALTALADSITRHLVSVKMRPTYFMLSSDNRHQANAALACLGAVASSSPAAARSLLAALDTQLSALYTLAKPPRDVDTAGRPIPRPQYWKQWRAFNPLARPSRALLFDLVLALVAAADEALLTSKLLLAAPASGAAASASGVHAKAAGDAPGGARSLVGALLAHCAGDPPQKSLQLLQTLAVRVLSPESQIPASVRSALWGDRALTQLSELMASDSPHSNDMSEQLVTAVQLSAQAAAEALLCLMTDPLQGLVGDPVPLDHSIAITAVTGSNRIAEGTRRVLRVLARLRPAVHPLHASLLRGVATRQPALAAEFIGSQQLPLEPKVSSMWVTQMTLLSTLVSDVIPATSTPSSLLEYLHSSAAALWQAAYHKDMAASAADTHAHVSSMPARGHGASCWPMHCSPPGVDSTQVRQWLRRCLPAALSKGVLSKGLSHPAPLVRLTTLRVLMSCLRAAKPVLSAAADTAAAAASLAASSIYNHETAASNADTLQAGNYDMSSSMLQPSSSSRASLLASTWASFLLRLRAAVKARLPDLTQLTQLLHTSDANSHHHDLSQHATAQASKGKQQVQSLADNDTHLTQLSSKQQQLDDAPGGGEGSGEDGSDVDEDTAALEEHVFQAQPGNGTGKIAAQLTGVNRASWHADVVAQHALQVLALLAALMPDVLAAAHVDVFKLPPAEPATLPVNSMAFGTADRDATGRRANGQQAAQVQHNMMDEHGSALQTVGGVLGKSHAWQQAWLAMLDASTSAAVHDQHADAVSGSCNAAHSGALAGPVSTVQLLPLLRLYTCAGAAGIRAKAGQLLLHFMQRSGIFTSAQNTYTNPADTTQDESGLHADNARSYLLHGNEALVWLWQLPYALLLPHAHSSGASQLPAIVTSTTPASLLCDAIVTVSRRPHEAYALLLDAMSPIMQQSKQGGGSTTRTAASLTMLPSPLVAVALRSCLRACKMSSKTSPLDKAALATYLSGVILQLAKLLPSPLPFLALLHHLLAAEWCVSDQQDSTAAVPHARKGGSVTCEVQIPVQGQPLVSAYQQLLQMCTQLRGHHPEHVQATSKKKQKQQKGEMSQVLQDHGLISLTFVSSSSAASQGSLEDDVAAAVETAASTLLSWSPGQCLDLASVQQAVCVVSKAMAQQPCSHAVQLGVRVAAAVVASVNGSSAAADAAAAVREGTVKSAKRQKTQHAGAQQPVACTSDVSMTCSSDSGKHVALAQLLCSLLVQPLQGHGLQFADVLLALDPAQCHHERWCDNLLAAWQQQQLLPHNSERTRQAEHGSAVLSLDGASAAQLLRLKVAPEKVLPYLQPAAALLSIVMTSASGPQSHMLLGAAAVLKPSTTTVAAVDSSSSPGSGLDQHQQEHAVASRPVISLPAAQYLADLISHARDVFSMRQLLTAAADVVQACVDPYVRLHACTLPCTQSTTNSTDHICGACHAIKAQLVQRLRPALTTVLMHVASNLTCTHGEGASKHQQAGIQQRIVAGKLSEEQACGMLAQLVPIMPVLASQQVQATAMQLLQYCQQATQQPQHASVAMNVLHLTVRAMQQTAAACHASSSSSDWLNLAMSVCDNQLSAQLLQAATTQQTTAASWANVIAVRDKLLQYAVAALYKQDQAGAVLAMPPGLLASVLVYPTPDSTASITHKSAWTPMLLSALHLCLQLGAQQQQPLQHEAEQYSNMLQHNSIKSSSLACDVLDDAAQCEHVTWQHGMLKRCTHAADSAHAMHMTHRQRLALLLPLIRACCCSPIANGINRQQTVDASQHDSSIEGILALVCEPLLAYVQRKRRKQVSTGSLPAADDMQQGTTTAVVNALHTHAVPVLCTCLSMLPLSKDEWHKVWSKVVPATGGWAIEPWQHAPEAGPGQQAATAAHMLAHWPGAAEKQPTNGDDAMDIDQRADEEYMAAVTALTRACCTTMAGCYKAAIKLKQQHAHSASASAVSPQLVQAVQQQVGSVLDGPLGDLVAGLGVEARQLPGFADLCSAAAELLIATLQYAGNDAVCVKRVRRLLAALMPEEHSSGHGSEEGSEDEGHGDGTWEQGGSQVESEGLEDVSGDSADLDNVNGHTSMSSDDSEQLSASMSSDEDSQHSSDAKEASEDYDREDSEGELAHSRPEQGEEQITIQEDDHLPEGADIDIVEGDDMDGEGDDFDEETGQEHLQAEDAADGDTATMDTEQAVGDMEEQQALQDALSQAALAAVASISHAHVSQLVSSMLSACVSHPAFLQGVTNPSVPQPLPAHVAKLPVPCSSLAPLVTLMTPQLVINAHDSSSSNGSSVSINTGETGGCVRAELLVLLETLLMLRRTYQHSVPTAQPADSSNDESSSSSSYSNTSDSIGDNEDTAVLGKLPANGHVGDAHGPPAWPATDSEAAALHKLLLLLLPTYHATLSSEDVACLRLLLLLDALVAAYECKDVSVTAMSVRLTGPLAHAGYLWSASAATAAASETAAVLTTEQQQQEQQQSLSASTVAAALRGHPDLLDARRVALTCVAFPHARTLLADEDDAALAATASAGWQSSDQAATLPTAAQGGVNMVLAAPTEQHSLTSDFPDSTYTYNTQQQQQGMGATALMHVHTPMVRAAADPAWMLPFCVTVLRQGQVPLPWLVRTGLLALCLRALGSPDPLLRAVAYEALGLFTARLEAVQQLQQQAAAGASAAHSASGQQRASSSTGRHPDDFRERGPLLALLLQIRHSVSRPLQRLPACVAMWAAEAACLLASAHSAPVAAIRAARKAALSTHVAAFTPTQLPAAFARALVSAAPTARVEQLWASQLLLSGLADQADVPLYRARYVPQLIMALLHSGLCSSRQAATAAPAAVSGSGQAATGTDVQLQSNTALLLAVVLRACSVLPLSKYLVQRAGVVPWLASMAAHYISSVPDMHHTTSIRPTAPEHGAHQQQQRTHVDHTHAGVCVSAAAGIALMIIECLLQLITSRVCCPAAHAMAQPQSGEAAARSAVPKLGVAGHAYVLASQQLVSLVRRRMHANTGAVGQLVRYSTEFMAIVAAVQQLSHAAMNLAPHMMGCKLNSLRVDGGSHSSCQDRTMHCWCQHLQVELQQLQQCTLGIPVRQY